MEQKSEICSFLFFFNSPPFFISSLSLFAPCVPQSRGLSLCSEGSDQIRAEFNTTGLCFYPGTSPVLSWIKVLGEFTKYMQWCQWTDFISLFHLISRCWMASLAAGLNSEVSNRTEVQIIRWGQSSPSADLSPVLVQLLHGKTTLPLAVTDRS